MPRRNTEPRRRYAPGTDVSFPQNGPAGSAAALTVTPVAGGTGGTRSVSAQLIITQIQ